MGLCKEFASVSRRLNGFQIQDLMYFSYNYLMGRKKKVATPAQKKAKARKIASKKERQQEEEKMEKIQFQEGNSDEESIGDDPSTKKEESKDKNRKFSLNLHIEFRELIQYSPNKCLDINVAAKKLKTSKERVTMMANILERQDYIEREGDTLRWKGYYAQQIEDLVRYQEELQKELSQYQKFLELQDLVNLGKGGKKKREQVHW